MKSLLVSTVCQLHRHHHHHQKTNTTPQVDSPSTLERSKSVFPQSVNQYNPLPPAFLHQVLDSRCLSPHSKMSSVSNIWCHDIKVSSDGQRASLTLSWQAVDSPRDPIDHCNIYLSSIISEKSRETDIPWKSERAFLGRSYVKSFRVSELYLLVSKDSENSVVFEFCVQPVTASRCKPPAGHCLVTIES